MRSAFWSNRPTKSGDQPLPSQEIPHHGSRQVNQTRSTPAATSRRRSRQGAAPRTARMTTTIQWKWWIHATGESRHAISPTAATSVIESPARCARWAIPKP